MKKIYAFVFLAINIFSASCMEVRKRKPYKCTNQRELHATPSSKTVQLNFELMEELYNDAYLFMIKNNPSFFVSENKEPEYHTSERLNSLIEKMHKAYKGDIHEDIMSNFTYDKYITANSIDMSPPPYIPLFFCCLKQYRLTGETLPLSSENVSFARYPAYVRLMRAATILIHHHHKKIKLLADCLFLSEKTLFTDCSQGCYHHLESEFYAKAYDLLISTEYKDLKHYKFNEIYDLMQIIEKAKKLKEIQCERDLGYAIFKLEEPTTSQFFSSFYSDEKKNIISLCCLAIKKYNKARGNKTNPTGKQYICYQLKKSINLIPPDSFNSTLFDEKLYAFTEFAQLIKDITLLKKFDPQDLAPYVAKTYTQR